MNQQANGLNRLIEGVSGGVMNDKQLQEVGVKAANSFYVTPNATPCSIFLAGWNTAIRQVRLLAQTAGGDGCFCSHHPDDPAHTKDCYDLTKALTGE